MPFIPNSDADREEMMQALGIERIEELYSSIPESARIREDWKQHPGMSEASAYRYLCKMAGKNLNANAYTTFLGAGVYDHYIPAVVNHASGRSEFVTAYTPYQPEVSQGTLQAIFEYQTMICELTGMDVSNASMYCGVSSTAEAVLLATSTLKRNKMLLADSLPDNYTKVISTYGHGRKIEFSRVPGPEGAIDLDALKNVMDDETAGIVLQYPNFYGCIEPLRDIVDIVHGAGGYVIASVNPIALALLRTPGEYGVDIVTGEGQVLGNEMNFGGPFLGIFAVKQPLVRKIPGRLSGRTVDIKGRQGFVLTLQTREQHIRREKATSNICTNQGLMMLRAAIYMETLGKEGLREVAGQCVQKAHYLAEKIGLLPGFSLKYERPFFHEFVVKCPVPAGQICEKLLADNIFAGYPLEDMGDPSALLIAVTEKRTKEEMDSLVEKLRQFG
ncbi:aminomethyl-transferring glycine dehydrogenase subunit GcvPA [candidate division KSB1 bacterium]